MKQAAFSEMCNRVKTYFDIVASGESVRVPTMANPLPTLSRSPPIFVHGSAARPNHWRWTVCRSAA